MMTLKMAIIAMMISSSAVPFNGSDVNKAIEHPRISEVMDYSVPKDTSALDVKDIADAQYAPVDQAAPVEEAVSARQTVNGDKTYEQCMREEFERIYEEINRMLNEVVDRCDK
ncbi:MAG: hypothetical protein Q8R38_00420 [Candidatus Omnitrophota bacterium]|nr:hypothetical protein [Candidatus Omnitrophota bacterium]